MMRGTQRMVLAGVIVWLSAGLVAIALSIRGTMQQEKKEKEQAMSVSIRRWYCPECESLFKVKMRQCPAPECGAALQEKEFVSEGHMQSFINAIEMQQVADRMDKQYELVPAHRRQTTKELLEEQQRLEFTKWLYLKGIMSEWNITPRETA